MYKTIFSIYLYNGLRKAGFEPILEKDNLNMPGFKCWVFEKTPAFQMELDRLFALKEAESNG